MARIDLESQLVMAAAPIAIPTGRPVERAERVAAEPSAPGLVSRFFVRAVATSFVLAGAALTLLALLGAGPSGDPYPF